MDWQQFNVGGKKQWGSLAMYVTLPLLPIKKNHRMAVKGSAQVLSTQPLSFFGNQYTITHRMRYIEAQSLFQNILDI